MENKIENIVSCIKKDGYFIMKNYYSIDQCDHILKDIQNISQEQYTHGEGNDLRITCFDNCSNKAHKFLNDNFLLQIGNSVLGHKVDRIKNDANWGF